MSRCYVDSVEMFILVDFLGLIGRLLGVLFGFVCYLYISTT